jgi:large conductance mechanosensitive channel
MLVGGVDFTNLAVTLKEATMDTPAVTVNYGNFIQTLVNFTIIAFAIFMIVKLINRFRRKQEIAPEPVPSKEALLLAEIRDLLRERK